MRLHALWIIDARGDMFTKYATCIIAMVVCVQMYHGEIDDAKLCHVAFRYTLVQDDSGP